MTFRFYNGGNAENVTLSYSVGDPTERKAHNALFPVHMPGKDFFEIPETVRINNQQHWTNFDQTMITRKGATGVVRIDPTAEETAATGRIARNDEQARKMGDEIHNEYLIGLVQDRVNHVESLRAIGATPLPAQGYTKYALKMLGVEDPAEPVRNHVNKAAENDRIAELETQVKALLAKRG